MIRVRRAQGPQQPGASGLSTSGAADRLRRGSPLWAGLLLAALALLGGCTTPPGASAPEAHAVTETPGRGPVTAATVAYVIDGDTIAVTLADGNEERVRLIGIDTPEVSEPVERYGLEAEAYTRATLDGATVYLETDAELRDKYGRLLAYVWTEDPAGASVSVSDAMFNARLLADGYAVLLTIPPNVRYAETFVESERQARANEAGLWGLEGDL